MDVVVNNLKNMTNTTNNNIKWGNLKWKKYG